MAFESVGTRRRNGGSKRKASQICFKTLAGETYDDDYDDDDDDVHTNNINIHTNIHGNGNGNGNTSHEKKNARMMSRMSMSQLYANKHIHEVLHRTYDNDYDDNDNDDDDSDNDTTTANVPILQTITDGSILTAANIMDPNHELSIHRPIHILDTPQSIGMKLPKGGGDSGNNSDDTTSSSSSSSSSNCRRPPTIRELGSKIGMKQPISVMDVRSQDELEGWNWSDMVDYFEDEDRKCTISHQHQLQNQSILSSSSSSTSTSTVAAVVDAEHEKQQETSSSGTSTNTNNTNTNTKHTSSPPPPHHHHHHHHRTSSTSTTIKRKNLARVLNQISLEFSTLPLAKYVKSPTFVRDIDWIDHVWPNKKDRRRRDKMMMNMNMNMNHHHGHGHGLGHGHGDYHDHGHGDYPRVQYYCLTSTAGCYTDFHIDFGGTSVWYHVISGRKTFLLIPPTETHLELYEAWLCRKDQSDIFFPDMMIKRNRKCNRIRVVTKTKTKGGTTTININKKNKNNSKHKHNNKKGNNHDDDDDDDDDIEELRVKQCLRVTLEQGQTFIIPTGWIHAVHTPVDSIVFGGNFLHGLDMEGQLKIHCLETRTRVPAKFRFPSFVQLMYYAGTLYFERLKRLNTYKNVQKVQGQGQVQAVQRDDTTALVEVSTVELEGLKTLVSALKTWAVNPGGDASRFGSVAHVGLQCVASVAHFGVSSMDDLLNGLMAEIVTHEQMLRDGIDIKKLIMLSSRQKKKKKKPTPAPRLKLSIKRKVSSDSSPPMKSPVTPISLMVEGISKKDHISGQPEMKASSSPSPPKLKLKLGKAASVPSLSSNSNSQQIEGFKVKAENVMESDEDVEDDDIIPAFTFSSSTGERADIKPTQPLSPMQPISNSLKTLSNVGPGNNRVSNRNKDLASRHNVMDDEWLPDEDVTSAIMDKKLLLQQSSKKKNTTRTSAGNKGKVVSSQRKKPKASGGGSRSRLMKKLKF